MDHIPISFDYKGKHYSGSLDEVSGVAAKVWYLMIDKYYYGRLMFIDKWAFHGDKNEMEDIADFFGEYVMLWYG